MSDELDYILTEPYQRGYQKGRADAIEEFARIIKPYIANYRSAIEHNRFAFIDVNNIAEQLKEQK